MKAKIDEYKGAAGKMQGMVDCRLPSFGISRVF